VFLRNSRFKKFKIHLHSFTDLDLRTSGIQKNKKSFMNIEITLFIHNNIHDFKSPILRDKIKKILNGIYNDDLKQNKHFTLSKTKVVEFKES
jgi:hypothetical protein